MRPTVENKTVYLPKTVMLAASSKCQANCQYCFMPHDGAIMSLDMLRKSLDFLDRLFPKRHCFNLIFHGGEPMLAGLDWYKTALALIRSKFGSNVTLRIQSNIWMLTQEWLDLFSENRVSISTSIDGPEDICDSQRGKGYFAKTMQGIKLMRQNGLDVSVVATIAKKNATYEKCREICKFFYDEKISFNLHGAVPSIEHGFTDDVLSSDDMLNVLRNIAEEYFKDVNRINVGTIDEMIRSTYKKAPCMCTFSDCLGTFIAIAPDGYLYSCQRFCGIPEYSLGNILNSPTSDSILSSAGYKVFKDLHSSAKKSCSKSECKHSDYCNGGCCYTLIASKKHNADSDGKDPFCKAFRTFYDELEDRMAAEMADKLMGIDNPAPLLTIAERKKKRSYAEQNRRKIIKSFNATTSPSWMYRKGLETVFLNITYNCPLSCSHCSANAGIDSSVEMSPDLVIKALDEAFNLGFEQIIITGGEPLFHQNIIEILESIAAHRNLSRTPKLILQTSLILPITDEFLHLINNCFDQINVSIDGGQEEHDDRRGAGSYSTTVQNIIKLRKVLPKMKVVLTPSLTRTQIMGQTGSDIKMLAKSLGNLFVEFRELKIMGRLNELCECSPAIEDDIINRPIRLSCKCGLGNVLHIEPSGDIYPCYAFVNKENFLGNIAEPSSLKNAVNSDIFTKWKNATVDTNKKCCRCDVRYLCGGVCKTKENCDYEYTYCKKLVQLANSIPNFSS